jgi:uncharacterized protein YndB with AHSA1/START domain
MTNDGLQQVSQSIVINAPIETLYDMLADVTRMGEWSTACTGATWDDGAGPVARKGSWFTGHNVMGEHTYDAHCEVTAAERPTTLAWMQGGADNGIAEWRYGLAAADDGTVVTESWTLVRPFPPDRVDAARAAAMPAWFEAGITQTLAKLKADVEG